MTARFRPSTYIGLDAGTFRASVKYASPPLALIGGFSQTFPFSVELLSKIERLPNGHSHLIYIYGHAC